MYRLYRTAHPTLNVRVKEIVEKNVLETYIVILSGNMIMISCCLLRESELMVYNMLDVTSQSLAYIF